MKIVKVFLSLLLLTTLIQSNGFGQIKIDDGSYTPNLNKLKEVKIEPSLPSYSELFEECMEEEPSSKSSELASELKKKAFLNLKRNDWCDRVNPVGESIFIPSNYPKRLFLNTKDKTATVKPIPQGYYTVVGIFGGCERNKELSTEAVLAHRNLFDEYTFDTDENKLWALCMLDDDDFPNYKYPPDKADKWVEEYYRQKELRNLDKHYVGKELNFKDRRGRKGKYSIHIIEDEDGNLYYDYQDRNGGYDLSDTECRDKYVSVRCYNAITELILNKDVIFEDFPCRDYLTKEILGRSIGKSFFCKDIFLRDGNLVGVFVNEEGEFTIKIEGYGRYRFDRLGSGFIGYKGVVVGDMGTTVPGYKAPCFGRIYPASYEQQIEEAIQLEKAHKETLAQKQKREKELLLEKRRKELIAKYGESFGTLIANGKVAIGMTKGMCCEAVGFPSNRYKATTTDGISEIWVYYFTISTITTLYFDDDSLYLIENEHY